jgi:Cys-tRNA(Pro)/Cys-tRNA(Cys) deacylase
MTPGINAVIEKNIEHWIHEYSHDESSEAYGLEAVEKMGVAAEKVFKTLVVSLDGKPLGSKALAVAVIPVASKLSMKLMAKACGVKKAVMADKADVERSTGYVLGGVSPFGQKRQLETIIDSSAQNCTTVYVSAGRRGLEIELSPDDLVKLTEGTIAALCQ